MEKKRRCQPWIQANYEVYLLEVKLVETDCDRRNERNRTFSIVPADLHLSFKKICFIKQCKFQFRSSLELDIQVPDFPSLFIFVLCRILQCKFQMVNPLGFAPPGLCIFVILLSLGIWDRQKSTVDNSLKKVKILAPWIMFQGLGLESALMGHLSSDLDPLSLLSPVGYCPLCIRATLDVCLCRPSHLSGRRHKSSFRKRRDVTSAHKLLKLEAANLFWTISPLNQSSTMSFFDLQKYAGIQGK